MKNRLLILIGLLMMLVSSAQGQSPSQELFTYFEGDLWSWSPQTGQATQLTTYEYNGGPVLSPDGRIIAYQSVASQVKDSLTNGTLPYAGDVPNNIWIMETRNRNFDRKAPQNTQANIIRSIPAWSPDSTRLVWSELQGTDYANVSLKIFDMRNGQTRTLTNTFSLGFQDGGLYMPNVVWGQGGISRVLFTFGEDNNPQSILEIYNPDTGAMQSYLLASTQNNNDLVFSHVWVEHNARPMIALVTVRGEWSVLDPVSGGRIMLTRPPAMAGSARGTYLRPFANQGGFDWQLDIGQSTYRVPYTSSGLTPSDLPALSYDGQSVAWYQNGTVTVWNSATNQTQTVLGNQSPTYRYIRPTSVVWSPTRWTTDNSSVGNPIPPPPTSTPNPVQTCNNPPSRLTVGQVVTVTPGAPNNVRAGAALGTALRGVLAAGQSATLLEGPVCNNGYNWWRITYGNGDGWTAEGGNGDYWLAPATFTGACINSLAARLVPGQYGVVTPGLPNVIRDNPNTGNSTVIGNIPAGRRFYVRDVGVCGGNDGRLWYPVIYGNISGWTAEGEGNTYWVRPD